jgi:hypothetical protein
MSCSLGYSFVDEQKKEPAAGVPTTKGKKLTNPSQLRELAKQIRNPKKRKVAISQHRVGAQRNVVPYPGSQQQLEDNASNAALLPFGEADSEAESDDEGAAPMTGKRAGVAADFEMLAQQAIGGTPKARRTKDDAPVTREGFEQMTPGYAQQYYQQFLPELKGLEASAGGDNQDLVKKLNYLIHLLEDQKDEKVGSITEELVLYCFLGVFIIFVLDSFVKVGKYIR